MRVLITGAAGFIGSHLAERFEQRGDEVLGIDNFETGREENYPATQRLDVTEAGLLKQWGHHFKPELVVHCAASYKDPELWYDDLETNAEGTITAAKVALEHGAKLVYFQTALPPVSSYAISKIAGEQYIHLSGVPHLIFRLANIYGPRNLSGPIPTFYKRLSAGESCTVVETTRDLVYIEDLVECVMLGISQDRVGSFDVCSGTPVNILGLYWAVGGHFPDAPLLPKVETLTSDDVMPDTSVHNWLQGWAPKTPLGEGIAAAVEWYREHGVENTYTHLALKG